MSEASAGVATHPRAAVRRAAFRLGLAAAPTFAIMALLTEVTGGKDMICSTTQGAPPLSGMALMYLLMAAFHLGPWLKLAASRGAHRLPAPPRRA